MQVWLFGPVYLKNRTALHCNVVHGVLTVCGVQEEVMDDIKQDKVFLQGQDRKGRGVCILQGRKHTLTQTLAQQRFISYVIDGMIAAGDPQRNPEGRMVAVFELQGERVWWWCWGHLGACSAKSQQRCAVHTVMFELHCCVIHHDALHSSSMPCLPGESW